MSGQTEACAAYFRTHPAYHRILQLLLRKYRSFGRPAGTVRLADATPEECEAARALFGRPFFAPLQFKAADFEAALQNTPYRGIVLKEVLECYFDTTIQTQREIHGQAEDRMARAIELAKASVQSAACHCWLNDLANGNGSGYALLRKAAGEDGDVAQRALLLACKSADWLESHAARRIRLAVLSANATSDPHALDGSTLCGKLFLHLLAARSACSFPDSAQQRDALYYQCGILCDSISSSVTQVGVCLYTEEGEHPAYRAFRLRHEAGTLTLTNLAGLTAGSSPSGKAYLVENQMVFSQLCDQAGQFHSPLICTSGQPSVAVIRLLDMLAAAGTLLFYSGDFDGKGLSIAAQLLARYPEHLRLWHMSVADYTLCRSAKELDETSLALLKSCADPGLAPAAEALRSNGHAGYQELLLPKLLADLTEI